MARVIVEADGGSRGNPGPAAYGALVRDAAGGRILAEAAEGVGVATNNVAEYKGLIAGLRLVREVAPDAEVEVRMDSKLVVEQMAGRWKVKHPDMRPLALEARRLAPPGTTWTWVPRERNKDADALLNRVLDGEPAIRRTGKKAPSGAAPTRDALPGDRTAEAAAAVVPAGPGAARTGPATGLVAGLASSPAEGQGWGEAQGTPTVLLLLRHGETPMTAEKRFSGSGGPDHALTPHGRDQMSAVARALAAQGGIDGVVSSPARRAMESAGIVAAALNLRVDTEPGVAETDFGAWEGLTIGEIRRQWPEELSAWLSSTSYAPPGGGEPFDGVLGRVRRARDRLVRAYPGRTVLVVSHVTPIKLLTCLAMGIPASTIFRMELSPASVSELRWYADGSAALCAFGTPTPSNVTF